MNESPSILSRIRAGVASMLSGLAAGFHWLEDRTSRGMRPWLVGAVVLAVAAVMLVGVLHERHAVGRMFGGRDVERHVGPPPAGKPEGRPDGPRAFGPDPAGKPEAKPHDGPAAKPEAPAPPAPPVPPAPAGVGSGPASRS